MISNTTKSDNCHLTEFVNPWIVKDIL